MMFYNKSRDVNQDRENLIFLYQAANFLGSKRIVTLFNSEECRFCSPDTAGLFKKLRRDLMFQLHQGTNSDYLKEPGLRKKWDLSLEEMLFAISSEIEFLADYLSNELSINIRKSDKSFTVSRGESVLVKAYKVFGRYHTGSIPSWLSEFSSPGSKLSVFYPNNTLVELSKWLVAMETLVNKTNHPGYEVMLHSLFKKRNFLSHTGGFPYDLLCHDRIDLDNDTEKEIEAILVDSDYPSSKIVRSGDTYEIGEKLVYHV